MEQKDPKDMTASELLRWAAKNEQYGVYEVPIYKLASAIGFRGYMHATGFISSREAFHLLADKIDAELSQARELSLLRGAELWAKANGWPDFRDGEDFGQWLDRCTLPRPRFDDGEVVVVREYEDIQGYCVYDDGEFFITTPNRSIDYAAGDRVKRPAPEALGADRLPIVAGETVWDIETGEAYVVRLPYAGTGKTFFEGGGYRDPAYLTHTPPDTQERIDGDAKKNQCEYFGHPGRSISRCNDCPSHDSRSCGEAMILDLLRRQRELDKRKGGAE